MANEAKREFKKPAHWPPIPAPYDAESKTVNIDLIDRKINEEQLRLLVELQGYATITFPLTEEEAYEMAEYLAAKEGWEVFVARGIRDKTTGLVRKMDMGSLKLPFVSKTQLGPDGEELIPLYPFTYLIFRKGKKGKDPERNWKYVRYQDIPERERAWFARLFDDDMNQYLPKMYRNNDGITWHQDNGIFCYWFRELSVCGSGKMFKFRDLHPNVGFQDLVLYPRTSLPRWLQLYNPTTKTTFNLLLPSGAVVTLTGAGNRHLWHAVPKDSRPNIGLRFSIVARRLLTLYNWATRKVYPAVPKPKPQKSKKAKAKGKKQAEEDKQSEKGEKKKKRKVKSSSDDDDDEIVIIKKKSKQATPKPEPQVEKGEQAKKRQAKGDDDDEKHDADECYSCQYGDYCPLATDDDDY